jgi:hypothetical protein
MLHVVVPESILKFSLAVRLVKLNGAFPMLETMMVCMELDEPTSVCGKSKAEEDIFTLRTRPDAPSATKRFPAPSK